MSLGSNRSTRVRTGLIALALLAVGCDAARDEEDESQALEQEPPCSLIDASLDGTGSADAGAGLDGGDADHGDADPPPQPPQVVRDPRGAYFAEVTANGTGCPPGTWNTEVSPDGTHVTATFSAFEAEVDETRAVSIKTCQLAFRLISPQGLSFSLQRFYQSGYTFLEEGVSARVTSSAYFQGNPSEAQPSDVTFVGPKDGTYLIENARSQVESQPDWSPCGVDRSLNVNTTLRLLSTAHPRRKGYVNLQYVFGLKVAWRRCSQ